ncbi:site-specific integrase [Azospirillum isscasi]|uniref:Tyr recombinase domain-containing protein n=1 Tax=Azospirillum isscasi TaxID=3053926 RepID=A0ABU0WMB7_9PROT|nr:hypothetical protein [Azospirillum isscasi]MDQ2105372.1 hypothetical protein [Azospirillum isscasi]
MDGQDKDELITALSAALDEATRQLQDTTAALELVTAEYASLSDRTVGLLERHADYIAQAEPERSRDVEVITALLDERDKVEKAGAIGQAVETIDKLGDLLGVLGVTMKSTPAPTVTAFLEKTYSEEKRLQDDSNRHVNNYIRLFARITGDKPLNKYQRSDVVQWVRTLERLKTSLGKSRSDDEKSIDRLLKESRGKPTMGETTIGKHIMHVKAMFRCAIKHHKFAHEADINAMFDGISLSEWVPTARKRKIWQIDQLNALFRSPVWSGTRSRREDVSKRNQPGLHIYRDAYWWLPVLALWTGARLEELAQLHHSDLDFDTHGTPFFKINDDGEKRVKTEHSIRNVPVHPFLVEVGALDLFKRDRVRDGRIFPELKPGGRMEKLGDMYSTHFTDYRRRCGLYEPLRDFHSLRRTFISTLRSKYDVHPLTVAALAGHDDDLPELQRVKQTEDYTDYDISDLARAVARLDYPALGLDVSNLRPPPHA